MLNNRFSHIGLSLLITLLSLIPAQILHADPIFLHQGYKVHNLVSDPSFLGGADHQDSDLVNAWGIAFNPDAVVWVNDNGTGKSTLYNGKGEKQGLVVTVPPSAPTGIVFFGGRNDFIVTADSKSAPSSFIFSTEAGTIASWASVAGTTAVEMVNNSATGTVYKGLALSTDGQRYLLYATDFHNAKVDVFDGKFQPVSLGIDAFKDPKIPAGFAPFGIQAINGVIFVTYAKQDKDAHDDVPGPGLGFVDAFDANGILLKRVAAHGKLNSPWGLALAPANFGKFSNHLLVGNFGDGSIIAFDLTNPSIFGGTKLRQTDGSPLIIDGLWGIGFGNGLHNLDTNALFFTAGPNGENNGLFGRIEAVSGHSGIDN
ncbi:MAG TPA: TIGR03118 family protein [Methylobacter sp.]